MSSLSHTYPQRREMPNDDFRPIEIAASERDGVRSKVKDH